MRSRAQNRFLLGLSVIKLAATLPLVLLCLRLWGPIGALLGFVTVEVLGKIAMLWRAARLLKASLPRSLPLRDLGRQALAAMGAVPLSAGCLVFFADMRFVALLTSALAFAAVYLALLWRWGALPGEWRQDRQSAPASLGDE